MFVVSGFALGPGNYTGASSFPLPATLAGTSIQITAGTTKLSAIMIYTLSYQVAAILPSSTPVGPANLTLTFNNQTSNFVSFQVVPSAFGAFTRNSGGSGPGIIQNFVSAMDQALNTVVKTAQPGGTAIIWGTGLGPVTGNEAAGPLPGDMTNLNVKVFVGGQLAQVTYRGRSGCCVGIDEVGFIVPSGVEGCYVPVAIQVNGVLGNFTSIAIASKGNTCSDTNGLQAGDLQRIAAGGSSKLAWVQLLRLNFQLDTGMMGSVQGTADFAWGDFFRWDSNTLSDALGFNSLFGTTLGTCNITTAAGAGFSLARQSGARLNIGPALHLQGPSGAAQLVADSTGMYTARKALGVTMDPPILGPNIPLFLTPGTYTIDNVAGGPDVAPFQAALSIPGKPVSLNWTNLGTIQTIDRSKDLNITWTGGDPKSEYVVIGGMVALSSILNGEVSAFFACSERVEAGHFVIPSVILSALPASSTDPLSALLLVGRVSLPAGAKFSGGGIDAGYFLYGELTGKNATYQ